MIDYNTPTCQGHGTVLDCCRWEHCDGHGAISYCDGTCSSAVEQLENDLRSGRATQPEDTTDAITLEVSHNGGWSNYLVTFEGGYAETLALTYMDMHQDRTYNECPTRPFSHGAFPVVAARIHPTCGHGLSEHLCYGPDHYMTRDQEMALYG